MNRALIGIAALGLAALGPLAATVRAEDNPKDKLKPPAQAPAPAQQQQKKKAEVLDFDADVIEGQKKTPELFLQTEVDRPSLEAILYQRRDFNDFHAVDSRARPRFSDAPKGGKQ